MKARLIQICGMVLLGATPVSAQMTLPLHPEEPAEEAVNEQPLPLAEETAEVSDAAASDAVASEAVATDAATASAPAPEAAPSPPGDFVGAPVERVMAQLTGEGWMLTVRTPSLVQLDDGKQGLDLVIDTRSGEILEATWVNLHD